MSEEVVSQVVGELGASGEVGQEALEAGHEQGGEENSTQLDQEEEGYREQAGHDHDLLNKLPDELLLHVFSYIPVFELRCMTALVCRRWSRLAVSNSLLTDLSFGPSQPTEVLLGVLQNAPHLRRLCLFGRNDVTELLRELTTSNPKMAALKISTRTDLRHVEVEGEVLLEFLRMAKNMRYLCLKRVSLDDPRLVFNELGSAAPHLIGLNLNHSSQVDTNRLHRLVTTLPKMRDLRIYSISYNNIGSQTPYTDTPVVELLTRMGDTLEVLKLNMMGLTGHVMPFLMTCTKLVTLHLYRATGIEDDAFILLNGLSHLRELMVTVPRAISGSCFVSLLSSPGLCGLRVLNVANSYSLDDRGLEALSSNCPLLEELGLPGCRRVTSHGLACILLSCPNLLKLNLFSVRASVAESFPLIPSHTPALQLLVYKPVDRAVTDLPPELLAMPGLVVKSVYRYR